MIKQAIKFFQLRSAWLGEGGQPVSKDIAQLRADTCLKCPMNVQEGASETVKSGVALLARKQIEYKNGLNLRVNGEKSLHICDPCGCVLRLKVWSPIKFIKETTDLEGLHTDCWIPGEIDNSK